jgi:hypothetical protein
MAATCACGRDHDAETLLEHAVPQQFRPVNRRGRVRGLARYGGGRLEDRLAALVRSGRLRITFDDIDMFQRIANVESNGLVQALNTWDSAVVSIGFLQLTLRYGELQRLILRAPTAFGRYGIAVDAARQYRFSDGVVPAIVGVTDPQILRWGAWADRFYRAGLDDDVIIAQVAVGLERNQRHLDALRRHVTSHAGAFDGFMRQYRYSSHLRAVYQESYNNRPAYARRGAGTAAIAALKRGPMSTTAYTDLVSEHIRAAYAAKGEASKADHIIARTRTGARPGLLGPSMAVGGAGPAGRRSTAAWNAVRATPGSIVAVQGLRVHREIAPAVKAMVDAAARDGIVLRGGGFRSPASQVDLRRQHCGPTPYDIYEKPSRECRPPTARPGRSRHQQGLAIDFRLDPQGRALAWLRTNAARFGLVNLPSEPWHWSVDGR